MTVMLNAAAERPCAPFVSRMRGDGGQASTLDTDRIILELGLESAAAASKKK